MPTSLSSYLNIEKEQLDELGCYDTILDYDSLFFINFLRLKECSIPELKESYKKMHELFRNLCILLDSSNNSTVRNDIFFNKALRMMDMSEFEEICLGYSKKGTSGSGSGKGLKLKILRTGKEIIKAGVKEPEIFELVGLFEDNIGPDRIGDFIGKTIKSDLEEYSKRIIENLHFDKDNVRFRNGLIYNEFNNKSLILLPNEILHELPIAKDWDDIDDVCVKIRAIREEINRAIGLEWEKYTKSERREILRRLLLDNPELLQRAISDYRSYHLPEYDFGSDYLGEATWYSVAKKYSNDYPLRLELTQISSKDDLIKIVLQICNKFKSLIENNGLNEVLFDDKKNPRRERIAQKVFHGISESYCEANNIDISPEVNSGRGALDFKFSVGYQIKVIVEVKLTTNNQLHHGYNEQLKEYQKAEKNSYPIYLVIDNGGSETKLMELINMHNGNKSEGIPTPELIVVDAVLKPTASHI